MSSISLLGTDTRLLFGFGSALPFQRIGIEAFGGSSSLTCFPFPRFCFWILLGSREQTAKKFEGGILSTSFNSAFRTWDFAEAKDVRHNQAKVEPRTPGWMTGTARTEAAPEGKWPGRPCVLWYSMSSKISRDVAECGLQAGVDQTTSTSHPDLIDAYHFSSFIPTHIGNERQNGNCQNPNRGLGFGT